jgi:Transglycosylase SLT domain
MRQLFVPACVCLMTWSGPTGSDPKLSLENFTGVSTVGKSAPAPRIAGSPATEENPASSETAATNLTAPSDAPIDIPAQTGVEQVLEPQHRPPAQVVKPVVYRSRQEVCDMLAKAAQSNDLPVPFFIRLLFQESGFKPDAVSRAGAQGVAQFMPETSADMGLDNPFDPLQAIPASARLLRNLFEQFGNLGLAAAAYNAGPKRIHEWLTKKGKLPQETQGYVKIITGRPAETWKVADARYPEMRLPRRAPCQGTAGLHAWNGPDRIPVPRPSPFTLTVSAPFRAAVQAAASTVRLKQNAARMTAINRSEKPAKASSAPGTKGIIRLAARKQPANKTRLNPKPGKMDHKTAGKTLELAMVARSSGK